MGLALAAIIKGYKLICTLSDKQSKEKIDVLKALGAEIHVCPTNVSPEHPDSYYSVAQKLNHEIPNSYFPNQYDNLSNRLAHYESTGPEIWDQTNGQITHFIVGGLPKEDGQLIHSLFYFILSGYLFKLSIALLDTIPFYILVNKLKKYV